MMNSPLLVFCLAVLLSALLASAGQGAEEGLDRERVATVAGMLAERPAGVGRPITDRAAWEGLAAHEAYREIVRRAESLLDQPLPEQPDDLYLDFSRTGNRTRWQRVAGQRRGRLTPLVLAECVEDQGRFVAAIEELVAALCAERTWVMPAHDRSLTNFRGEAIDIDLASSAVAWELATADYLLGDRLSAASRDELRENVRRRVLEPYREMYTGARDANWWMKTTNNWNAVCLAGVTGAGLAQLESREQRAELVVAAEKYSHNFLAGFTGDGYCSEGLGYWNYGFGHYVLLAETVRQATGGGVDLLALSQVRAPATFGARIQIMNGVYPAFADCAVNARPSAPTMYFVSRCFGLGLAEYDELDVSASPGSLCSAMIYSFPNAASEREAAPAGEGAGLRTWFDEAGVLIGRPAAGSACRLGVALKGGHNAEHHNHNDVGSYVVVSGERAVLLDPGSETYTARTFSGQRYESKLLNSYGHPVPVVAGQLQRTGREARAEVLRAEFTEAADTLELDISAAYEVPELKALVRTFVYSREERGSLTVTDRVEFTEPKAFETALVTDGGWQRLEDGGLLVYDLDEALRVDIAAEGAEFTVQADEIHEDARAQPTRLGIRLAQPVTSATITVTVTPMEGPADEGRWGMLRNGGFEYGSWCWSLPRDSLGSMSEEQAASGRASLKISDHEEQRGSNVSSARMPVEGAGSFLLSGKVLHVSGSGIGMYLRMLDAEGRQLNPTDERGYIAPVGTLSGAAGAWEAFEFGFETPAECAAIVVWIHSYSTAQVEAYLDDLSIVRAGAQ